MAEKHDETAGSPIPQDGNGKAEQARKRFEDEKMTRREALRRIGMAGGMTIFAMLSANDLARIAAKKLQEHEASKAIGDTLAKEFRSAGVAFANPSGPLTPPPNPSGCSDCTSGCIPDADYDCVDCPPECATPSASGGGKKKRHKCSNAQALWDECGRTNSAGYDNQIDCCQTKCQECCAGGRCGSNPSVRDGIIATCQESCQAIHEG